jgi:hypothetical protein
MADLGATKLGETNSISGASSAELGIAFVPDLGPTGGATSTFLVSCFVVFRGLPIEISKIAHIEMSRFLPSETHVRRD